jgi:hypothetical protein
VKRLIRRCRELGMCALPMSLILMSCRSEAGAEKIIRLSDYQTRDSVDFRRLEADVRANVRGKPHSSTRPAKCKNGKPGCLVEVDIAAAGKSWDIQLSAGPGGRRAIGYIQNKDPNDTEEKYSLAPSTTNIVVLDDAPFNLDQTSRTIWGFQQPDGKFVKEGYVIKCHPNGYSNQKSDLDFRPEEDCPHPMSGPAVNKSSIADGPNVLGLMKRLFLGTGVSAILPVGSVWFECDPGCCSGTTSLQL